jgi:hypothetical protein
VNSHRRTLFFIYIYIYIYVYLTAIGLLPGGKHTFNKETTHTFHDITQHSTNSIMEKYKYKNSNTSTMNIYKYNEHKQHNEHFKKE